jgi:GNAT superfamily N-acetyltransferase
MMPTLVVRCPVEDSVLSELHALAFGNPPGPPAPWRKRLERYALTWVGAFDGPQLIGFVYCCWDGGSHAFVLDPIVHPQHQRQGIGRAIVEALMDEAAAAGCTWLHVDYEPHLAHFYEHSLEFKSTRAGLRRLS